MDRIKMSDINILTQAHSLMTAFTQQVAGFQSLSTFMTVHREFHMHENLKAK